MAAEGKQVRLLPGRRVPGTRYRLVRWLGEGGMGVVYEAEHEDIERRVALKILRIEASEDPHQAAQFREEARAASRIGSPNIVEIFDFGELPDGRLMFAMELLNGHGLDTELDRCPIDQAA
jgi:serine/threonine protein kinase